MTPKWLKNLFGNRPAADIEKASQLVVGATFTCYEDLDSVDYNVRDVFIQGFEERAPDDHLWLVWVKDNKFPRDPSFAVIFETDVSGDTILHWQNYHLRPRDRS